MKNFLEKGETTTVATPSGGYVSGQSIVVGDTVGVSSGTYAEGETAVVNLCGVYVLPKASSGAIAQGVKVYVASSGANVTTTNTQKFAGYAHYGAADGETTIAVLLAR